MLCSALCNVEVHAPSRFEPTVRQQSEHGRLRAPAAPTALLRLAAWHLGMDTHSLASTLAAAPPASRVRQPPPASTTSASRSTARLSRRPRSTSRATSTASSPGRPARSHGWQHVNCTRMRKQPAAPACLTGGSGPLPSPALDCQAHTPPLREAVHICTGCPSPGMHLCRMTACAQPPPPHPAQTRARPWGRTRH